jgi:hypothetical protein
MSEKRMKRWGNGTGFLLAVMVPCVVLVATVSTGYAVPAPNAAASVVERPVTILDPFSFKVVTVSNLQSGGKAMAPSALFVRPARRHPVRIPVRPPLRSAFKPDQ